MARTRHTARPSAPPHSKHDAAPRNAVGVHKRRRRRPGTLARKEVRRYTRSVEPLLKRAAFRRIVSERMCAQFHKLTGEPAKPGKTVRLARDALDLMQCATEDFLVRVVTAGNDDARRHKRVRLFVRDLRNVYALLYPHMAEGAGAARTTHNSLHGREPPAAITRRAKAQPKPAPPHADAVENEGEPMAGQSANGVDPHAPESVIAQKRDEQCAAGSQTVVDHTAVVSAVVAIA